DRFAFLAAKVRALQELLEARVAGFLGAHQRLQLLEDRFGLTALFGKIQQGLGVHAADAQRILVEDDFVRVGSVLRHYTTLSITRRLFLPADSRSAIASSTRRRWSSTLTCRLSSLAEMTAARSAARSVIWASAWSRAVSMSRRARSRSAWTSARPC